MTRITLNAHSLNANTLTQPYDVVVLGAGVIGISTAYWLSALGVSVLVVDECDTVGMGTSYANGGQISVCHAEPWANPSAVMQVLKWLPNPEAPLLFKPKLDMNQWRWLMGWLGQCRPTVYRRNIADIVELALHSRECLKALREQHSLDYQHRSHGIMHFYQTQSAFEHAQKVTRWMQEAGCERSVISAQTVMEKEPALSAIEQHIVGGTFTAEDESGNAHLYCQELAAICQQQGVEFALGCKALPFSAGQTSCESLVLEQLATGERYTLNARETVVCLGAWSAPWLRACGERINMYPAKGYSLTVPIENEAHAPNVSLTDDEYKLVISRLGNELRVAGTAELSGYSTHVDNTRCAAILTRVKQFFPNMSDYTQVRYWAGLRPATPSNVPIMGAAKRPHVWINTGHGTLGWTMACGTGQRVAHQVAHALGAVVTAP